MPRRCVVGGCDSRSTSDKNATVPKFHIFPKDEDTRKEWIQLLGINPLLVTDNTMVCSNHFRPEDLAMTGAGTGRRVKEFRLMPLPLSETTDSSSRKRKLSEASASKPGTSGNPIILDSPEKSQSAATSVKRVNIMENETTPRQGSITKTPDSSSTVKSDPKDLTYEYDSPPSESFLERLFINGNPQQPKQDFLPPDNSRNFIVNEQQLRQLLNHCPNCGTKCENVGAKSYGVDTTFLIDCKSCQKPVEWATQPKLEESDLHGGNLLMTAAVILAGNTFEDLRSISENANMEIMSHQTFYRYANSYLYPAIDQYFHHRQREILEAKKEEQDQEDDLKLQISMDCRFSRPGFTATYGLVSAMCLDSGLILSHVVKSKTDNDVSSSKAMETVGTRIVLKSLICPEGDLAAMTDSPVLSPPSLPPINLRVGVLVTDENQSVAAMIRKEFKNMDIQHENDPWHMCKAIIKKFTKAAKKAENAMLGLWIPSIRNWLWTIMKEADGCDEILVENWRSMLYHIIGVHQWPDDDSFLHVHACSHGDLSGKQVAYLSPTSPAYAAFARIVEDKQIHKRLRKCTLFLMTSLSESFHSVLGKYAQKRLKFSGPVFEARAKLAVLDWNENVQRPIAKDKTGADVVRFVHPHSAGAWRAKVARVGRSKQFVVDMMETLPEMSVQRWKKGIRIKSSRAIPTHKPLVDTYEPLNREQVAAQLYRE